MSWTLCIDFGTAFSKAAAAPADAWRRFDPAQVRPLMLNAAVGGRGNAFLLDSAVFVDDTAILFGAAAVERATAFVDSKRSALRSFKTLLSVSDLERALAAGAPASIDPHRAFVMRDLIVLYLAYLTAAVTRAVAADPALEGAPLVYRYAAPAWRSGDGAGLHDNVVALFGEAHAVRQNLGDALIGAEGVSLQAAQSALAASRGAAGPPMGLIFEATAAAAYSAIGLAQSAPHLIVVDMGAGTTDIAALAGAGEGVAELPEARLTLRQAGDFIDGVIANIALDAHKGLKTPAARAAFWRVLMRDMRGFKEVLFAEGRVATRYDNRAITVTLRDLERDKDFRLFNETLSDAYERSFNVLRDRVLADRARDAHAIAVGGGAAAPFIQAMIGRKPSRGKGVNVIVRPATPDWAHAPAFRGNLAPVFPQLAISIGGALAPGSMIAAGR